MSDRNNAEWMAALSEPGPERDAALEDLRQRLSTGLRYALRSYPNVGAQDVDDFVQEALIKILDNLHTFRGESHFLTWAQKIAVHLAISELRRFRWRDVPLLQTTEDGQEIERLPDAERVLASEDVAGVGANAGIGPEERLMQAAAGAALRRAIAEELTPRQRRALLAIVVQGMPMAEVAHKMGTNTNALYKLLHDARKKLKQGLEAAGLPPAEILAAFEVA
ncbi:MAG: RNA polymerase sigma factor [Anaerolineae bacterium]|nr:RNA polymerase sigma factor [Anaerolineae bacterium]